MIIQFSSLIENSPKAPGVYLMYDADGMLLYVGKAKNLNARLKQYNDISKLEWHKRVMRSLVARVEWTTTATESDALVLEEHLIKTQKPKYNIILTDGKMYPMLMLTGHEFPHLVKFRARPVQKKDVFGPYPSVSALNSAIKQIQKVCQVRTCTDSFMNNRARPCLLHQIGRCSAPCINKDKGTYDQNVKLARKILSGDTQSAVKELSEQMTAASNQMNYELAAELRDKISDLSATIKSGKRSDKNPGPDWMKSFDALENWLGFKIERVSVFDNSHLFGKNPVGAMVVFDRTGFIKSEYRHFKLRDNARAGNDISMMEEFLKRSKASGLVIVDGGKAQWNIAKKVLDDSVIVLGITKGEVRDGDEHFIMPDGKIERNLSKDSPIFLLLRRVRDEAHRFAISFHRRTRAKSAITSALDEIEGIGAARKRALLHHFGSVRQIADSSPADLARAPGISKAVAQKIYAHFH
ncbi:MAG: excinuclease ABC subunit UvrC [Alphaproteobacteria bacterium]|nr:excinuclease ABC subunit UvrC [Alphaproteobacteria bacterium]